MKFLLALVSALLVSGAAVRAQEVELEDEEEKLQHLKILGETNDLKDNESFRCGVFFAGRRPGDKPVMSIFVLPRRFKATCPAKNPLKFKAHCLDVFQKVMDHLTWETNSRKRPGFRIGDDLCMILQKKRGITKVPNKRRKKGLKVGFYYNHCTDKTWYDTSLRVDDRICCDENSSYVKCEDVEGEDGSE